MSIPLLDYTLTTQNNRVAALKVNSEEDPKSINISLASDNSNIDSVISAAYQQIFFHAFKSDRQTYLESQLRDGQITVRDFVKGLCLSDTFKRSFYNLNSNYRVVRHLVQKLLGRKTHGRSEEISLSIVLATKGTNGLIDQLIDSQEYLDNFGYDTVPTQRNRILPGREIGETPFNITTPRYDSYYRSILGFPQIVYTGTVKTLPARAKQRRGGYPEDYLSLVRTMPAARGSSPSTSADIDYLSKVPYRSIGR